MEAESLKSPGILCSICHETSAQIDAVYNEGANAWESFVPVQSVREADSQGFRHLGRNCTWTSANSSCLNSQTVVFYKACFHFILIITAITKPNTFSLL